MIEKVKFFFRTAGNNLWQFRTRNLFSITIICLSFLIVGVFLALSNNLRYTARELSNNMTVAFFLDKNAAPADVEALAADIRRAPFIEDVRLVSADEAMARFRAGFPELKDILTNLKDNPFPASLEARVRAKASAAGEVVRFVETMKTRPAVVDVQFNQDWVEKMQAFGRLAGAIGFFLGGILVLASFFIVSNVIKINVFARGNEIEILRLVGASNIFIRVPFWLEGMAMGLLGSLMSLGLLFIVLRIFPVYLGSSLGALQQILSFRYPNLAQSLALLAAGAATGFTGSATAVSKFLKI